MCLSLNKHNSICIEPFLLLSVYSMCHLYTGTRAHSVQLFPPSLLRKEEGLQLKIENDFYSFSVGKTKEIVKDKFLLMTENHFHFYKIKVSFTDQCFPSWFGNSKGVVYKALSESFFFFFSDGLFIFTNNISVSCKQNILPVLRGWRSAHETECSKNKPHFLLQMLPRWGLRATAVRADRDGRWCSESTELDNGHMKDFSPLEN